MRRSQTLCCPPLPADAAWKTDVKLSATTGGSCGWDCKKSYTRRTRHGKPPPMAGDTVLFGWSPEVCCANPANSKFTGGGCAWRCDDGFTRNLAPAMQDKYAPYDPAWACPKCNLCPSGQYVSKPCTHTAQTVCSPCRTCSAGSGLTDGGGCVGEQDRACVQFFTHSGYPELAKDISSTITYHASRLPCVPPYPMQPRGYPCPPPPVAC